MTAIWSRLRARWRREYRRIRSYVNRPKMVIQTQAVPLINTELCQTPIFLIGVNRSGTSLCRRIVDCHSRIACPPETYFLAHFAAMTHDDNSRMGFEGFGFGGRQQFLRELRRWSSQYHEAHRLSKGKARWADKTPQYTWILPEIDEIFGPKVQYLMILRHPLEVVYSVYARRWRLREYHEDLLMNSAYFVADGLSRQTAFARMNAERCFRLYYEDLVLNPERVLRDVFEFLNEPWEPDVLAFNKYNHNFGGEDTVVMGMSGFSLNWGGFRALKHEEIDAILPIIRDSAAQVGYSLDDLSVPSLKSGPEVVFAPDYAQLSAGGKLARMAR